ncbi:MULTISPECIES: thiamine pyrophosphate-dependent enzyme [unclassified Paenibacillus]|uniref:thiamine pyrophosphate-dependent enzyme n=1 Tax=Paenibacillus TaxID=44249 RepID=UPI0021198589|nr:MULTISPECIES: thiamine pyrophosphate-dependent enzyme [unclassified Paenibacillus]
MTHMTAAKAIVEVLLREGVEKAFCVPGESYLSVLNVLYETPRIELISGRHEGGVSFMAEGYAKASGKVGVCFATRGPGATNLSIGLHTAHQDSTPMVAFIGQVESSFRGREGFQEIDLADYFRHLVKWTVELNDARRVPELVHRAFHMARSGRPGPVLISLPQDVLDETAEMVFQESEMLSHPRPDRQAVAKAKEILRHAKRPVIIAGGGVTSTKSAKELVKLAEKLQVPVATAFRRFDAFPNQHPYYIGQLGVGAAPYLVECVREADVVLALGTRFSQITTQNYTLLTSGTKLIHVDISPDELNKVYRPALGIVADTKNFMLDLLAELGESGQSKEREAYIQEQRKKYEQYSEVRVTSGQHYVNLEGIMGDLMNHLPSDTIFTSDAGNFYGWMAKHYRFQEEGTFVGPTSGAMGYALPAAIGAKVAQPEKTVVAYAGDGGFMMTVQELETAVRCKIPVLAIVANNNMYGTIRMHQEKHFPKRVIATELSNPNFAQIMTNMGGHGELVEKNEDFVPALQRALASSKPALIEVRIDPQQVSAARTIEELRAAQPAKQK